jgi:hypothetical protein
MKRIILATTLCLMGLASIARDANADFTAIPQPDLAYTSSTTLIDISSIPNGTTGITSVTDGSQTVSFDSEMTKTSVGEGWSTWNSPPAVESSTPDVLFQTESSTLTMTLGLPSTTFGFELQGNQYVPSQFYVAFMDGVSLVGFVDLEVDGDGGALLFAGSTTTSPFTSVIITNTSLNADGFAVANLRYTAVPEPASVVMIVQAIGAVGYYGWRKRRHMAVSSR